MPNQDFVSIPVPKERVQEVYELLAEARNPDYSDPKTPPITIELSPSAALALAPHLKGLLPTSPTSGEDTHSNGEFAWPRDLLIRAYRESPPAMRVVFDHLASNAGHPVTATGLAKAIEVKLGRPDYGRDKLAGVLGAFGRRWKNRYRRGSREDGAWPFEASWNSDLGMNEYTMSIRVAQIFAPLASSD